MPIIVEAPDGTLVEFPDGTPDDVIAAAMAQEYGSPERAPDYSTGRGVDVWIGGAEPEPAPPQVPAGQDLRPNQMLGAFEGALDILKRAPDVNMFPGQGWLRDLGEQSLEASLAREMEKAQARGERPGAFGRGAGEFAVAAPYAAFGGPAVGGAIQGFATSDADNLIGRAQDAAIGAAGGKVGAKVFDMAGGAVRGVTDPLVRTLAERGVQLSPGQVFGGAAKWAEDRATSLPFVGPAVDRARTRALDSYNIGALNEALAPIGVSVPEGMKPGHDAVEWAGQQLGERYDALTPGLSLSADPRLMVGARRFGDQLETMPADSADTAMRNLQRLIQFKPDIFGTMSGQAVRRADSEFGARGAQYAASPMASEKEIGVALRIAQEEIRDALARQNPPAKAELDALNRAFRNMLPVEQAASGRGAREGVFTPSQLKGGSRATDRSPRKRDSARGRAAMQRYAEAGQEVMTALPNSGTADRVNWMNPAALLAGAIARMGYSGAEVAAKSATEPRDQLTLAIARELQKMQRPAAVIASTAATQQATTE